MEATLTNSLAGRKVLVTGGTGSFGSFVVRRLLDQAGAGEVRVLSRDEKKQYDMRVFYGHRDDLTMMIGDVRDPRAVDGAMAGVDVVIHAAALKQVPTCERFPVEAVETNVVGARNVVDAALRHGVSTVVSISSDKAVKPVNVMGMTKALQERIVLAANGSAANHAGTRLCCVRYGNVLRTRGSIVPLFRRQLARGERLTVTDERMTRFLLTLGQSIDLVFFAAEHGDGGDVFVRKAPSAYVLDIAKVLAAEAGVPLDYSLIGAFPGEKLDEILVSAEELSRTESAGDYFRIRPGSDLLAGGGLTGEYSSAGQIVEQAEVARLIAESDREFDAMGMADGEFSRF